MDSKYWRRLSPLECERLQTVPDNYTNHVSSTQRYKMLGNGMTVDVIAHILRGTKWSDNLCIECHQDTSFGSGLFVNRIPAEHGTQDGYLCHQCQLVECDKCGQGTLDYHLDGNILCNDCWEH